MNICISQLIFEQLVAVSHGLHSLYLCMCVGTNTSHKALQYKTHKDGIYCRADCCNRLHYSVMQVLLLLCPRPCVVIQTALTVAMQ